MSENTSNIQMAPCETWTIGGQYLALIDYRFKDDHAARMIQPILSQPSGNYFVSQSFVAGGVVG